MGAPFLIWVANVAEEPKADDEFDAGLLLVGGGKGGHYGLKIGRRSYSEFFMRRTGWAGARGVGKVAKQMTPKRHRGSLGAAVRLR